MTEILLHRFWSHVSNKADHKAVLVPNPDAGKREYYPTAVPYGGVGATAYREEGPFKELTWSDVGAITAEIMNQLMQLGVERGDRVAILSWNTPEWVWTDIAIQSLGAVTVPIYPNSAADQVNFILGNCQSQLLIGDSTAQTSKVAAIAGA
ncbi:MAG: AMP-binding protein, partial [Bdellovibrionales bacterium]|nr:AMP-binding protein [Bdellovibrionales bacterium]